MPDNFRPHPKMTYAFGGISCAIAPSAIIPPDNKLPDKTEKTVGIRTIYEITEHTIDKHGQYFFVPDIALGTYWTNLPLSDRDIIELYHAHGESEQCHSEIKTDMDVEKLPSGKFDSNQLVLELTSENNNAEFLYTNVHFSFIQ